MYVRVMYALVSIVFVVLAGVGWLTFAMRKAEQSKTLKKAAKILQFLTDLIFGIFYMTIFDFLLFMFDCEFQHKMDSEHSFFPDVCKWPCLVGCGADGGHNSYYYLLGIGSACNFYRVKDSNVLWCVR